MSTRVIAIILAVGLAGCVTRQSLELKYSVVIQNVGKHEMFDVSVVFGGMVHAAGRLRPGVQDISYSTVNIVPSSASVMWRRDPGVRLYQKRVSVSAIKDSLYQQRFHFRITDEDDVSVVVEELKDRAALRGNR